VFSWGGVAFLVLIWYNLYILTRLRKCNLIPADICPDTDLIYAPSEGGPLMKNTKRKTICLVSSQLTTDHGKRISRGIAAQCEKYGYDLAVFSSMVNFDLYYQSYARGEINIYDLINFSLFDGVILDTVNLMSSDLTEVMDMLCQKIGREADAPVVCIGIPYKDLDFIGNSNDEQLREICRHAARVHGCRDICILTGPKDNHEAEERLEIMLDELHKQGLEVSDEHRIYGDFWYTSGIKLAQDIISGAVGKPDAVIAASDHMALGFIDEYTKQGRRVPEDMVVLGFEATNDAMLADIPLTSIESNFAKCAADAVDHIRRIIEPDMSILPYETNNSTMMHFGKSCGCTPDMEDMVQAIRTSLYHIVRYYSQDVFEDNVDIGLLLENFIPEQLTASDTPDECIENIYKSTYAISPFLNFYLCLSPDWLDPNKDIILGHPDKTDMVILRSNTGRNDRYRPEEKITFDTSVMLPQLFEQTDEPSAYYFSAAHFSDKTLGYAVLQRRYCDSSKFNIVYRNWLRFVNNALEMSRARNRFFVLSVYDKMTGLYNRRGLYSEYDKLVSGISGEKEIFVSTIDMDGLKYINDTFGHSAGDEGIICIADAVRAIAAEKDIMCRAGGDEFIILGLRECGSFDRERHINEFCSVLEKLSGSSGRHYPITASIGCAVGRINDTEDPKALLEDLLEESDEQMYRYKSNRRRRREDRNGRD